MHANATIGHMIQRSKLLGALLRRRQSGAVGDHEAEPGGVRGGKLGCHDGFSAAQHEHAIEPGLFMGDGEVAQIIELQVTRPAACRSAKLIMRGESPDEFNRHVRSPLCPVAQAGARGPAFKSRANPGKLWLGRTSEVG